MFVSKLEFLLRLIFSYQIVWLYLYNDALYDREGFNLSIFIILGVTRRRKSRFNILLHFFVVSKNMTKKPLRPSQHFWGMAKWCRRKLEPKSSCVNGTWTETFNPRKYYWFPLPFVSEGPLKFAICMPSLLVVMCRSEKKLLNLLIANNKINTINPIMKENLPIFQLP